MVMLSSMEIINFPEYLAPSQDHASGRPALGRCARPPSRRPTPDPDRKLGPGEVIVSRIVEGAEKLKVKTVISPDAAMPTPRCAGKAPT